MSNRILPDIWRYRKPWLLWVKRNLSRTKGVNDFNWVTILVTFTRRYCVTLGNNMQKKAENRREAGRRWRSLLPVPWMMWLVAVTLVLGTIGLGLSNRALRNLLNPWEGLFVLASVLAFATPGALITVRRRGNRIGWLFLIFAVLFAVQSFSSAYAVYVFRVLQRSLPGAAFFAWLQNWLSLPIFFLVSLFLLLYPDGRLPSRRWSFMLGILFFLFGGQALVSAIGVGEIEYNPMWTERPVFLLQQNPAAAPVLAARLRSVEELFWIVGIIFFMIPAIVPLLRYRAGDNITRKQLRWLMIPAVLLPIVIIANMIGSDLNWSVTPALSALWMLIGLVVFPLAVSVAILRHQLYDIDLIIRRTLVYGVLTAALGLIYLGSVAVLQSALPVTSELAIVVSTLTVAALFNPLRGQIQAIINRRFYRNKYDAEETLAAFGAKARDEIDLNDLTAELLRVVDETMQPESASLWLRER